jgi:hypothetical protein
MSSTIAERWYRDKWPWLLMAAPAASVFAGVGMLCVAITSNDGLVADDYYKQGLAINQTLSRDRAALAGAYTAHLLFTPELDRVRVSVSGAKAADAVILRLVHPTRAGEDRIITLSARAPGVYEGDIGAIARRRWGVSLEDAAGTWRLNGEWHANNQAALYLTAAKEGG